MKVASGHNHVSFKNQSSEMTVIRESKGKTAQSGKAVGFDSNTDSFVVQNKTTGQVENWPKKETVGVDAFINKKAKQIDVASQIISYQAAENSALAKENQELKAQLGQNLNKVV